MLCPKCFQENDDNTLFCKHCGSKLVKQESTSDNPSSILLLVWAIIFFVTGSIQTLITTLVDDWYFGSWRDFYLLVWGVRLMSHVLLFAEIKDKTMEIAAIIFKQESTSDNRSIILLWVWLIISCITLIIIAVKDDWFFDSYRTFFFLVCAVHNASCILPAVAIKNKTMKIVAIVLIAIPTLYNIYYNISAIFTEPVGGINLPHI